MNKPDLKVVNTDSTIELQDVSKKAFQCVICYKTTTFATENVCELCSKIFRAKYIQNPLCSFSVKS